MIVGVVEENNSFRPNLPDTVGYRVIFYDLENNRVEVEILDNPNNLAIEEILP